MTVTAGMASARMIGSGWAVSLTSPMPISSSRAAAESRERAACVFFSFHGSGTGRGEGRRGAIVVKGNGSK